MTQISPPSEDEVKADHHRLYRGKHMQSVASHAGSSATTYSRQRNVEETFTRNPIWEVQMEMYASVVTDQREIGKGVFRMLHDYGVELGLADEQPIDILELAIHRLKKIDKEQIEAMAPEQRFAIQGFAAELEEEANRVKTDAIRAKYTESKKSNAREFEARRVGG